MFKNFKAHGFGNVAILSLAQMFAFTTIPILMLIGSLIGAQLAPNAELATLPIAAMIIGTAIGTVPMALLMQRFGRKPILLISVFFAAACCFIITLALQAENFIFYCSAILLLGVCMAAVQQIRFAAMESVASEKATSAASAILAGGIIAALVGPELAVLGKTFTSTHYQGSFYFAMLAYFLSAFCLFFYTPSQQHNAATEEQTARPLKQILNNRNIWLAIASGAGGYALMSFVMTATPISMHHLHGHSLADTKWVIQSHITFMFLPSLITPLFVRFIGLRGMIFSGLMAYIACVAIASNYNSAWGFWAALVLLGIGWNFLFIAGTSLLPQNHHRSEQYKVQAFNDGIVFGLQAIASLSAGFILSYSGWQNLLLMCLPVVFILLALLLATRQHK